VSARAAATATEADVTQWAARLIVGPLSPRILVTVGLDGLLKAAELRAHCRPLRVGRGSARLSDREGRDVFSGSKHESDAKEFDTRGVTVFARKPKASSR